VPVYRFALARKEKSGFTTSSNEKGFDAPHGATLEFLLVPAALRMHLMSSDPTLTDWVGLLKAGDRTAVQPLWERYFRLLVSPVACKLAVIRDLWSQEDSPS
jgi:hypothetical protein